MSDHSVRDVPAVAVVLLNWRAPTMTLNALDLVFRQNHVPDHVFVVENGSGDDSAETLRSGLSAYGGRASLIVNDTNKGFGGGCNSAIDAAAAGGFSYVWLLNNDACPEPDCLAELLRVASETLRLGAVGSLLIDPEGHAPPHFGSWMKSTALTCGAVVGSPDLDRPYSWCTAASLLLDMEALRTVGGFDERFFMYWEDADLNQRLRGAGYVIVCAPHAKVLHHAGTSSASIPVQRYLWHFASQRRFLTKHHQCPRIARIWLRAKFLLKALYDLDAERFRRIFRFS